METEHRRDAQRLCHGDRPRRRPPGRGAGSDGAPDPPGRPGRHLPPAGARHPRPHLRTAARPLPPHPGAGHRLRDGVRGGRRPPGRAGPGGPDRPAGRGLPAGRRVVRHRADPRLGLRRHQPAGRTRRQRAARQRVRRLRAAGDRRPGAERRVGGRRGPQRLPRVHQPRLRRDRADRQPGGPGRGRPRGRAAAPRGGPAGVRAPRRAGAVRADGPADRGDARRRGAARRRRGAVPGRDGLRLRRRDAADLPAQADHRAAWW